MGARPLELFPRISDGSWRTEALYGNGNVSCAALRLQVAPWGPRHHLTESSSLVSDRRLWPLSSSATFIPMFLLIQHVN